MRVEVKVKGSSRKKLMHMSWSCEKMGYEKRTKRAHTQKVEGKWRRGRRPKLQSDLG